MIQLIIDPYCQNCPEFEPEVDKNIRDYRSYDMCDKHDEKLFTECDTTIRCKHKLRCQSMRDHIRKELKKRED